MARHERVLLEDQITEIRSATTRTRCSVSGDGQHVLISKTSRIIARDGLHRHCELAKVGNEPEVGALRDKSRRGHRPTFVENLPRHQNVAFVEARSAVASGERRHRQSPGILLLGAVMSSPDPPALHNVVCDNTFLTSSYLLVWQHSYPHYNNRSSQIHHFSDLSFLIASKP